MFNTLQLPSFLYTSSLRPKRSLKYSFQLSIVFLLSVHNPSLSFFLEQGTRLTLFTTSQNIFLFCLKFRITLFPYLYFILCFPSRIFLLNSSRFLAFLVYLYLRKHTILACSPYLCTALSFFFITNPPCTLNYVLSSTSPTPYS